MSKIENQTATFTAKHENNMIKSIRTAFRILYYLNARGREGFVNIRII